MRCRSERADGVTTVGAVLFSINVPHIVAIELISDPPWFVLCKLLCKVNTAMEGDDLTGTPFFTAWPRATRLETHRAPVSSPSTRVTPLLAAAPKRQNMGSRPIERFVVHRLDPELAFFVPLPDIGAPRRCRQK